MAEEKKKFSLGGIDNAAEEKGSFMKTLWQLVKFLVVSGLVTISLHLPHCYRSYVTKFTLCFLNF